MGGRAGDSRVNDVGFKAIFTAFLLPWWALTHRKAASCLEIFESSILICPIPHRSWALLFIDSMLVGFAFSRTSILLVRHSCDICLVHRSWALLFMDSMLVGFAFSRTSTLMVRHSCDICPVHRRWTLFYMDSMLVGFAFSRASILPPGSGCKGSRGSVTYTETTKWWSL